MKPIEKTLGQELYELLNPYDPHAGANPATWDQVDEDWHAHYERCAAEFRRRQLLALAEVEIDEAMVNIGFEDHHGTPDFERDFRSILRELAKENDLCQANGTAKGDAVSHPADALQAGEDAEPKYAYAYVVCQRKGWHLGPIFSDWEEVAFERFSYTESYVFRKRITELDADGRQLWRDYDKPPFEWQCPSSFSYPPRPIEERSDTTTTAGDTDA